MKKKNILEDLEIKEDNLYILAKNDIVPVSKK
jgi:hypothetical protein